MKRIAILTAFIITAVSMAMPAVAAADTNDFTVTDFTADYYLTRADAQGSLRIIERINVDFQDHNHGILRAIPLSYKDQPLHMHINKVSSPTGAPANYTISELNGNEVLRIGDPARTVTGKQAYLLDYSLENVITFYGNYDEIYWDINGDQWDQPFSTVRATIHLPAGLKLNAPQAACYAGGYGDTLQDCTIAEGGGVVRAQADALKPRQTLTVVLGFQKGYFHPAGLRDYVRDYWRPATEFVLPIVVLGGAGFMWWLKRGRDPKGKGTIVPQYDAPDAMSPLEVTGIMHVTVETKALTATIIDLAIRKYIRIIEQEGTKSLFSKKKKYMLQLLRKGWSELNTWEQEIMRAIFKEVAEGDEIELATLATKLSGTAGKIRKSVASSLVSRGYFVTNPAKYAGIVMGVLFSILGGVLLQGMQQLQVGIILAHYSGHYFAIYLQGGQNGACVRRNIF